MARGESPFQGRYTVPIADFSGIERGGAAWGEAFKGFGEQIGQQIEKYGLDKQKRAVLIERLEGTIKSMEKYDPEGLVALGLDKDADIGNAQEMTIAKLEATLGKASAYSTTALNNMERRSFELELTKQEDAESWKQDRRRELGEVRQELVDWSKKSKEQGNPLSDREILETFPVRSQALIANWEKIDAGTYTPQSQDAALAQTYNIDVLTEKLAQLPTEQLYASLQRERQISEAEAITPEDHAELARLRHRGAVAEAEDVPSKLGRGKRMQEAQLKGLEHSTSKEMLELGTERIKSTIQEAAARIKNYEGTEMRARLSALAKNNPSLYAQIEDNRKRTKAAFGDIVSWIDADGNKRHGDMSKYNDALAAAMAAGKSIIPSQKIIENEHVLDELERQSTQLLRDTTILIDDTPSGAGELPFGMEPFEEWKGGLFGVGESSYREYVEDMKSKGFLPDQIPPPPAGEVDWRR